VIGRPGPSEAAPYYFTYIDRVIGEDALGVLASQLGETVTLCADVSEERSLYRYAEDKWSIRQVLNHVTDSESFRIPRALVRPRVRDSSAKLRSERRRPER
jgi:hypothetical protein